MSEKSSTSIAKKLADLEAIVQWFESDAFTIEDAIGKFEAAEKIASSIEKDLTTVKNTILKVKKDFSKE